MKRPKPRKSRPIRTRAELLATIKRLEGQLSRARARLKDLQDFTPRWINAVIPFDPAVPNPDRPCEPFGNRFP